MQYLLRREDKSDDTYEHILEVHFEKKDIRRMFKKKKRFIINVKDIAADEDVPVKLTDVIIVGVVKEKKGRGDTGKKIHDRCPDKGEETKGDATGEGLSYQEEES